MKNGMTGLRLFDLLYLNWMESSKILASSVEFCDNFDAYKIFKGLKDVGGTQKKVASDASTF